MKKRTNVIFSSFSPHDKLSIANTFDILRNTEYVEEIGMGYSDLEVNEDILYCTLIKRTITSVLGFNSDRNNFESVEIPIFDRIPFCLDFGKNLLYTFGANTNQNKIKSALRNTFDFSLTYNDYGFTPIDIMARIIANNEYFNIDEIVIDKLEYKVGIFGKYIAKVSDQSIGKELIDIHKNDVLKISINVIGEKEYYLVISSNALSIKCEEDDFFSILENLKSNIHGRGFAI
ncbi:MAG: hypothetical protein H6Q14_1579 [Bacteroidetes bacterium]|nr:hypothetical protein [Bacteroidota bacterium]